MKKTKGGLNRLSAGWNVSFTLILFVIAVVTLIPVLLVLVVSFSSSDSIAHVGYTFLPEEWSLEGYRYLFKMGDQIPRSYLVTTVVSVCGTVLSVFIMSMYAYVICQRNFRLHRFLTWFMFFTMLFGAGLVPSYIMNTRYYHLKDTIWILILPGLVSAYNVIILRTFIRTSIPDGLMDAARIDGAGHFTIFLKIVLPLSKAGLATVGLFGLVSRWNDWFTGMLYIENPRLVMLQTLLYKLQNNVEYLKSNSQVAGTPEGAKMLKDMPSTNLRMACTMVVILPILFAYPFFQRYFVNGLTVGSIKE